MTPPECHRCHETPWGDACKCCGSGNYSERPDDNIAKLWAMAAEYLRLKRELQDIGGRI